MHYHDHAEAQLSGLLAGRAPGFAAYLAGRGYAKSSVKHHLYLMADLWPNTPPRCSGNQAVNSAAQPGAARLPETADRGAPPRNPVIPADAHQLAERIQRSPCQR